jgi:hypothetical protein
MTNLELEKSVHVAAAHQIGHPAVNMTNQELEKSDHVGAALPIGQPANMTGL